MKYDVTVVSKGVALGKAYVYKPFVPDVKETVVDASAVDAELALFDKAQAAAEEELNKLVAMVMQKDPDKAMIFEAHMSILKDDDICTDIKDTISGMNYSAEWATMFVYDQNIEILSAVDDPLIRERVADLYDVRNRLLRCAKGLPEVTLASLEKQVVVVAEDLFPSDTVVMDKDKVLGIITEKGGVTSHSAIIARGYGIPAVFGAKDPFNTIAMGQDVIVDAIDGAYILDPTEEEVAEYTKKKENFDNYYAETQKYLNAEAVTKDGVHIDIDINIGAPTDEALAPAAYTDGIGLIRSEFLYMDSGDTLPDEETQYQAYKKAVEAYGGKPVTLRTMDIGGDKQLPCLPLPKEDNPFLGKRALRLCFDRLDIFKTQLRAALRASVHGNLWIMFPMVGSIDDIRKAKSIVDEVKAELDNEGIPYNKDVKIGIMVEIPSIAIMSDLAAKESDFCSIGSNDLCQYATATDRLNPEVTKYYQSYSPALFRLIRTVVENYEAAGKSSCICGELGGDTLATAALVGFGMRKLSMSVSSVAGVKKLISNITIAEAKKVADDVCAMCTAEEVEAYLKAFANDHGII